MKFLFGFAAAALSAFAAFGQPSRPAFEKCHWQKFSDRSLGIEAWVQPCDYGFRKISFLTKDRSLAMHYSDGGGPEKVVDVFDLRPAESARDGLRRIFNETTDKSIASRCVLTPYAGPEKVPAGVKRYKFVPDKAYQRELDRKAIPGDIPEPACGDRGENYDAIEYWEVHAGAARILFVRYGQDTPLFDEQTLKILK